MIFLLTKNLINVIKEKFLYYAILPNDKLARKSKKPDYIIAEEGCMLKDKGFLILVEGDELSDKVLKAAKKSNFEGTIYTVPWKIAEMGGVPLPRLFIDNVSYETVSVQSYFASQLKS